MSDNLVPGSSTGESTSSTRSAKDDLRDLLFLAYKDGNGKFNEVKTKFRDLIRGDEDAANLLWELFRRYYDQAFSPLFADIAQTDKNRKEGKGNTTKTKKARSGSSRSSEANKARQRSLLKSFFIKFSGSAPKRLDLCSAREVKSYIAQQRGRCKFFELLAYPLTDDMIIGEYYRDDTVISRLWEQAHVEE